MILNVLGTNYEVSIKKYDEDKAFEESRIDGYCDSWTKQIVVCEIATHPNFKNEPKETCEAAQKETLRHEIVHAFLDESGLASSSARIEHGWAKNEEMVDWIALQGIKICKAWKAAGAI